MLHLSREGSHYDAPMFSTLRLYQSIHIAVAALKSTSLILNKKSVRNAEDSFPVGDRV